jgi:biopolymer transport protein ExbB
MLGLAKGLGCHFWAMGLLLAWSNLPALAQEESSSTIISQAELQDLTSAAADDQASPKKRGLGGMSFLRLLVDGGALMIPIGLMSLLVVAVVLERWVALRRNRLFPRRLRRELRRSIEDDGEVSPAELFRTTEHFPSVAARVLQELLGKTGRPIPEAEAAISESLQREADRLYGNVRWLTLAAAVTPLIGLLGTVWGMIIAFYNTTQLSSGMNRAEYLAEGIYVALVTTLAGLAVAIPAAIFAHYFEGKITKNLGLIDWELRRLVPRLEQFEGRTRFDINSRGISQRTTQRTSGGSGGSGQGNSESSAPPVRAPKLKL